MMFSLAGLSNTRNHDQIRNWPLQTEKGRHLQNQKLSTHEDTEDIQGRGQFIFFKVRVCDVELEQENDADIVFYDGWQTNFSPERNKVLSCRIIVLNSAADMEFHKCRCLGRYSSRCKVLP